MVAAVRAAIVERLVRMPNVFEAMRRIDGVEARGVEEPQIADVADPVAFVDAEVIDTDGVGRDLVTAVAQVGDAAAQPRLQALPALARLAAFGVQ